MLFARKNEKPGKGETRSALPKAKENLINRIWYHIKSGWAVGFGAVFRHAKLHASFVGRDVGSRRRTRQGLSFWGKPSRNKLKKASGFGVRECWALFGHGAPSI